MRCRLNSTGNFGKQLKRLMQSINEEILAKPSTAAGKNTTKQFPGSSPAAETRRFV